MARSRHKISNIVGRKGDCSTCGLVIPLHLKRGRMYCGQLQRTKSREHYARSRGTTIEALDVKKQSGPKSRTAISREHHWFKTGIVSASGGRLTMHEFEVCFAQQGCSCAICASPEPMHKLGWFADHDHKSGIFRGVLCHRCNQALGFYENIGAAQGTGLSVLLQQYLDRHARRIITAVAS